MGVRILFEQFINRQRRGGKFTGLEQRSGTLFAVVTGRLGKLDYLIPKSECFVVIQSRRQPGGALQRVIATRSELQCGAIGIGRFQKIFLLNKSPGFYSKRVGALCFQPTIGRPQCEQGCQQQCNERDPKDPPAPFGGAVEMASSAGLLIHSRRDIQTRIPKAPPHTVPGTPRESAKKKIPIDSTS